MVGNISCKRVTDINVQELADLAEFQVENEKYVLVVPQNGCSTCVKKSYDFILKYYDSDEIKYLFTHYSSRKAVKVRFHVLGLENSSRLGFIELGDALGLGLSQMYPSLIEIKGPDLGKVRFMNAEDGSDWKGLEENILN